MLRSNWWWAGYCLWESHKRCSKVSEGKEENLLRDLRRVYPIRKSKCKTLEDKRRLVCRTEKTKVAVDGDQGGCRW